MKKLIISFITGFTIASSMFLYLDRNVPETWSTHEIKAYWNSETPPQDWITENQITLNEIENRIEGEFRERLQSRPEIANLLRDKQFERLNEMKNKFGEDTIIRAFVGPGKYRGIEGFVFYKDDTPMDVFIPHGFVFSHMPDGTIKTKG